MSPVAFCNCSGSPFALSGVPQLSRDSLVSLLDLIPTYLFPRDPLLALLGLPLSFPQGPSLLVPNPLLGALSSLFPTLSYPSCDFLVPIRTHLPTGLP